MSSMWKIRSQYQHKKLTQKLIILKASPILATSVKIRSGKYSPCEPPAPYKLFQDQACTKKACKLGSHGITCYVSGPDMLCDSTSTSIQNSAGRNIQNISTLFAPSFCTRLEFSYSYQSSPREGHIEIDLISLLQDVFLYICIYINVNH